MRVKLTARVCLPCRNIEYLRKASKEKIFTDFISNNSDKNRKLIMSNLFVKFAMILIIISILLYLESN